MHLQKCVITFGIIASFTPWIFARKAVFCYIAAWSVGRSGNGKFSVLDADTEHCTHIVYAFMGLDESTNKIKSIEPYVDLDVKGLGQNQLVKLRQLKIANPNLKVLASIGGYNEGGKKFSDMAMSEDRRQTFIASVIEFLRKYQLDGLDFCWQFPGQRGGKPEDKVNSLTLFRELKEAFEPEGWLLTVHIIGKRYVMDAYNIRAVSDVVDYISVVAVEYSGPWERKTGIMAPLTSKNELNVKFSVDYMLKKGANPSKLLLGLPMYGHAYLLPEPPKDQYIGLFTSQTFASQWTTESGITGYHETCYNMKNEEGWKEIWDAGSQTPLALNDKKLISFDNEKSLLLKASIVNTKNLGGVMVWSLDMDDFRGLCHGVKYPLVTAISRHINKRDASTSSEPKPLKSDENNESSMGGKTVVCYMVAWSTGRRGAGKFSVLNADVVHCTHVIYAFMTVDESTSTIKSIDNHFDQKELPKLKDLKKLNPKVKLLASIGGWLQGSKRFSDMATSPQKRETFINSVKRFIKNYELDGIDICWQFPGQRGGKPEDKQNVVKLFRELKKAFESEGFLLTVHILGQRYIIDSYDIKAVSDIVDFINFAAVEYHGPWEKRTAVTTPLTSSDESNVKFNLDYILEKGASPSKLLLGLPMYGHFYILAEAPRGQYLGLYYDHVEPAQWTNEAGLIGYNEVCYELTNSEGWVEVWEEFSQTPMVYNDRKIAFYDNERSLLLKAKLVETKQLAGVMIWSLDMDDFQGLCQKGKYPMVSAITKFINSVPHTPAPTKLTNTNNIPSRRPSSGNKTVLIETYVYGSSD